METSMAIAVGALFAASIYLILRRDLVRLILGIGLLSQALHLVVFVAGGLTRGLSPLIPEDADLLAPPHADPLPQALVLTAIVINFGLVAFALTLAYRTSARLGTQDVDALRSADRA